MSVNETGLSLGILLAVLASICGFRPEWQKWVIAAMTGVSLALSAVLVLQGMDDGKCPSVNPMGMPLYWVWSLSCLYLLVGRDYRMSRLGIWSAPLVVIGILISWLFPPASGEMLPVSFWVHGYYSFGIIALGAFGLSFVATLLGAVQTRRLKRHRLNGAIGGLPPIRSLDRVLRQLVFVGFCFLVPALVSLGIEIWVSSAQVVEFPAYWVANCTLFVLVGFLLLVAKFRGLSSKNFHWSLLTVFSIWIILIFLGK